MKHAQLDAHSYILRLDRGDQIIESLEQFARSVGLTNGAVQGIGSIEEPTLAHYSVDTKLFTEANYEGIYEVVSLLGNIGLVDDAPTPHLHVVISNEEMNTHGGHLKTGSASATLELVITSYPSQLEKRHDDTVGLNIWAL